MNYRRWAFALAAAVTAAATIDPIIERLSNAGLFGAGIFTDHSYADVLPALGAGILCSFIFVALATLRLLGSRGLVARWLAVPARELDPISVRRMLPVIFALQVGVLFVIETAEQYFVYGHLLGGTLWLGAPAPISLGLHFIGCILISFTLSRALRSCAYRVVAIVRRVLQCIIVLGIDPHSTPRAPFVELVHVFEPLLNHPRVRPPPLPAA